MTLTDFLLDRIAEDEEVARAWADRGPWSPAGAGPDTDYDCHFDPARVLAECEAKRRIVALHSPIDTDPYASYKDAAHLKRYPPLLTCPTCKPDGRKIARGELDHPCATLLILATTYAEHPDYRSEWAIA